MANRAWTPRRPIKFERRSPATRPRSKKGQAGSAVPIKFSLGGNRGLAILAPGSPVVTAVACASGVPIDEIETTVASSNSALQYDADSNTYTFVWKTPSSFAGSCRRLDLRLVDGTSHVALFRLR